MCCPTLNELPPPSPDTTGWPWTEGSPAVADTMPDGSPWPRITVVTPSYNQGQFLEETIRSVLLQGYPNLEYIIIDGGSADNSVDIIRKYESKLTYWVSEPDDGQSDAINKGFAMSTGDILAWMNSDDYYAPGALFRSAHQMCQMPEASAIYTRSQLVDEYGEMGRVAGNDVDLRQLLSGKNMIPQPSSFIRRSELVRVGGLDPSLHLVMDWDLWLKIMMEGEIRFIADDIWSYYRLYPESKTGSWPIEVDVEMRKMIERIWRHDHLPENWSRYRSDSLGATSLICASRYYRAGDVPKSRRCVVQAIQENPRLVLSLEWSALVARTALGAERVGRLKRMVGHPRR